MCCSMQRVTLFMTFEDCKMKQSGVLVKPRNCGVEEVPAKARSVRWRVTETELLPYTGNKSAGPVGLLSDDDKIW